MTSHVTPRFRKLFKALPAEVRQTAKKNYTLWKSNPSHPSLDFKQAHTYALQIEHQMFNLQEPAPGGMSEQA